MHQHHQSANPHIVGTVGETDEEYGGDVMNDLLLEVLEGTHRPHNMKEMYRSITRPLGCGLESVMSRVQVLARQMYMLSGVISCCV